MITVGAKQNPWKTKAASAAHRTTMVSGKALPIQASLPIGQPGDAYEVEADHIAEQVMQMPEHVVQRNCSACEEEVQAKPLAATITPLVQAKGAGVQETPPWIESQINEARSGGNPLPDEARSFMEGSIGADFSGVKVHTGSQSEQLNRSLSAQAFTVGSDVFFGAGKYSPNTSEGKGLLAHELTHVVQQGGGSMVQKTEDENCDRAAISNARQKAFHRTQVVMHHLRGLHPTSGRRQQLEALSTARRLVHPRLQLGQTTEIVEAMVTQLGNDNRIICGPERDECASWNGYVVGNRPPIHLCQSWFGLSEEQQIRTLIHEAAHASGIGEPDSEQYIFVWDCVSRANDFHSADAWAHFINCASGQPADQPEVLTPETAPGTE